MAHFLPNEILSYIFGFLGVSDRKFASLVCRQWYDSSLHPRLHQEIVFVFTINASVEIVSYVACRKPPHVIFNALDIATARSLLGTVTFSWGAKLHSLSLKGSDVAESDLVHILAKCISLRCLDLSGCNSLFMSGNVLKETEDQDKVRMALKNLTDLRLCNNRYISDSVFNRLMSVMPNISSLALASCYITFNKLCILIGSSRTNTMITFDNIVDFLSTNASRIKSLDFSRTSMGSSSLMTLASIQGLRLRSLRLTTCREISDKAMAHLCKYQTELRYLDLEGCLDITDTSGKAIAAYLTNLISLNVSKCRGLTNSAICQLRHLQHLKKLELSTCLQVTSDGWIQALDNLLDSNRISYLNLSYCAQVGDSAVSLIAEKIPNLKHLDLTACNMITDRSLEAVCTNLVNLSYLSVAWCPAIEHLIMRVRKNGVSNESFSADSLAKGSSDVSQSFDSFLELYSINNLRKLRTLSLCACTKLNKHALYHMQLPMLTSLDIGMIPILSDKHLCIFALQCRSLEELNISQCHQVTDKGLMYFLRKNSKLKVLDISGCDYITAATLACVEQFCISLRRLDVSMCSGVSLEAVENMELNLPHLNVVKRMLHYR